MRPKRKTSGYPRVECIVPDCKCGTTRFPPLSNGHLVSYICPKHWRPVPKHWKRRLSLFRRREKAYRLKGDDHKADMALRCEIRHWERIKRFVLAGYGVSGLPVDLESELRRVGLL